jgi:hypothetical protein
MKKIIIATILATILIPKNLYSQKAEGIAAAAGIVAGIGAGIAAIEILKEQLEQGAVEYALNNYPDIVDFKLKTNSLDGTKMKDISSVSIVTFELENIITGERFIMFAFTSGGWMNNFGVDFSLISWRRFDVKEWNNLIKAYAETASKKRVTVEEISNSKIVNKGVKKNKDWLVEFDKLGGDTYYTNDYSDEFKIVFNEKSLGIYVKETSDLVQISRSALIKAHEFLNGQKTGVRYY